MVSVRSENVYYMGSRGSRGSPKFVTYVIFCHISTSLLNRIDGIPALDYKSSHLSGYFTPFKFGGRKKNIFMFFAKKTCIIQTVKGILLFL